MTKEEIQKSMRFGTVYTVSEFKEFIKEGSIIDYDGVGYFHDGENETEVSVFSKYGKFRYHTAKKYPFVCWYNR